MKKIFLTLIITVSAKFIFSQDLFFTRTGKIDFHAGTSLEDIDATNNEVASLLNVKTGEMAFTVLIKSFHFKKALMEEHFNENYMESDRLPKASFSGIIKNAEALALKKDGTYDVTVEGDLTIHGVTKKVSTPGKIDVKNGKITASTAFKVKVEDYKINIPGLVADKISKEVMIKVECRYEPRT